MHSSFDRLKIKTTMLLALLVVTVFDASARIGFMRRTADVLDEHYYDGTLTPRSERTQGYNIYDLDRAYNSLKDKKMQEMGLVELVDTDEKKALNMARIRRLLAQEPRNAKLLSMAVNQSLAGGRNVDAFAYGERLVEADPDSVGNWILYGKASLVAGMFDEARDACRKILQMDPGDLVGRSYKACLDLIAGVSVEDVFTELQPLDLHELRRLLAWLAKDADLLSKSMEREKYMLLCAAVFAEDEVALMNHPFLKNDMDHDAATELLERAGRGLEVLFSMRQQGDWQAARREVRELREIGFNPPELQKEMAMYLFKGGDQEGGVELAEKIRRRYPGWREINILYAGMLYDVGRKAESLRVISRIHKKNPEDIFAAIQYGVILLDSGDYESARDLLKGVGRAHPNNAHVAFMLACAYAKTGDMERGLKMVRNLSKEHPSVVRSMLNADFTFVDWIPDELRSR